MSNMVFLNNELLAVGDARVSVTDSGFLYGAGLFETMRSRNGVVFRLQDHLDRLFRSAEALSIVHSYQQDYLQEAAYRTLRANELADARLRLTLTGGPLLEAEQERKPTLLMLAVICACLLVFRWILIPMQPSDSADMLMYQVVALYVTPVAAFLIGFLLAAAPLEDTQAQPSRLDRVILSAALTSAVIAVLLHNLIDFAIFEPGVWMTFWVVLACLVAGLSPRQADSPDIRQNLPMIGPAVIIISLALLGLYYGYVWRPVWNATTKIQQAQRAISTGQFDQAHKLFDAAFAADPLSAVPPGLNGRLYVQQYEQGGQKRPDLLEKAARCFRKAIDTNPADYKSYEKLAQMYGVMNQWEQACEWYGKAANLYPGCERLWFRLAQAAEQLGRTGAALTAYARAVDIEENYQQQFRQMYPDREEVISRLGDEDLAIARKRMEELSKQISGRGAATRPSR